MRTRKLTTAALLAALCVVLLMLANVLPVGSWVCLAAASMIPALAVIRCGLGWGAACYAVAAALTLLLFPGRLKGLLFVLVLGHYSVLKSLIERMNKLPLEWICKLALFNGMFALCQVLIPFIDKWYLWLAANVVFVVYDLGFTAIIGQYLRRFPGKTI